MSKSKNKSKSEKKIGGLPPIKSVATDAAYSVVLDPTGMTLKELHTRPGRSVAPISMQLHLALRQCLADLVLVYRSSNAILDNDVVLMYADLTRVGAAGAMILSRIPKARDQEKYVKAVLKNDIIDDTARTLIAVQLLMDGEYADALKVARLTTPNSQPLRGYRPTSFPDPFLSPSIREGKFRNLMTKMLQSARWIQMHTKPVEPVEPV